MEYNRMPSKMKRRIESDIEKARKDMLYDLSRIDEGLGDEYAQEVLGIMKFYNGKIEGEARMVRLLFPEYVVMMDEDGDYTVVPFKMLDANIRYGWVPVELELRKSEMK